MELHPGVPPAEAGASVGLAEGRPSGGWVRSSDWLVCLGPAEGDPCLPNPVEKPHRLEPRGWCFSAEMASLTQARPRPALGRDPVGTGRESPWGPALRLPLASPCPHTHPVHSALLLSSWCELAFQWEKHVTEYRENKVEIIIGGKANDSNTPFRRKRLQFCPLRPPWGSFLSQPLLQIPHLGWGTSAATLPPWCLDLWCGGLLAGRAGWVSAALSSKCRPSAPVRRGVAGRITR